MVENPVFPSLFAVLVCAGIPNIAHADVFELASNGNIVEISRSGWQPTLNTAPHAQSDSKIALTSTPSDTDKGVRRHIQVAAARYGVDTNLVDAVAWQESRYKPHARSRTGAIGVMQLMPDTARQLGVRNPHDVEQNVTGGTAYLRQQLERFGNNVPLALAAYNAGPGAVIKHRGIPPYPETQKYVQQILRRLSLTSAYRTGY